MNSLFWAAFFSSFVLVNLLFGHFFWESLLFKKLFWVNFTFFRYFLLFLCTFFLVKYYCLEYFLSKLTSLSTCLRLLVAQNLHLYHISHQMKHHKVKACWKRATQVMSFANYGYFATTNLGNGTGVGEMSKKKGTTTMKRPILGWKPPVQV